MGVHFPQQPRPRQASAGSSATTRQTTPQTARRRPGTDTDTGARPGPRRRRPVLLGLLLSGVCAPAALAGSLCAPVGGTSYLCSGDQSGGITLPGSVPVGATSVSVQGLSGDVPFVGIQLPASFTESFALGFTDPQFKIWNDQNAPATGVDIEALSQSFNWWDTPPVTTPVLSLLQSSSITTTGGNGRPAIRILSTGAKGTGGSGDGGKGHAGRFGRDVELTLGAGAGWVLSTAEGVSDGTPLVDLQAVGGSGGPGANASNTGGGGGPATPGPAVRTEVAADWTLNAHGIGLSMLSKGGSGAGGGTGGLGNGGLGGPGGDGGDLTLTVAAGAGLTVNTIQSSAPGLRLLSQGGNGGNGGRSDTFSSGGRGGEAGWGGKVDLEVKGSLDVQTLGAWSPAVSAQSVGGVGGNGGDGGVFGGSGGAGADSGSALWADVQVAGGSLLTFGADSPGIVAQSVAGHGGSSGSDYSLLSFSASGGSAGHADMAAITNGATVTTTSDRSPALSAQSIGGGGGNGGGGFGLFFAAGNKGGNGGFGGPVNVTNTGALTTSGADAQGLYAQSIGGGGGDGGWSGGTVAIGGKGAAASDAADVTVTNSGTISTGAATEWAVQASDSPICGVGCSAGIVAQSIGGGGGNGGSSGGWFSIGGDGGGGGAAGTVTVHNHADVTARLDRSEGILAQSLGGGGGNGGAAVGVGGGLSVAIGGNGPLSTGGGNGDAVQVYSDRSVSIATLGDKSAGVFAQSVGGGGGNGGFAVDLAGGTEDVPAISAAVGGGGGKGGDGGFVRVDTTGGNTGAARGTISTQGDKSDGILAQSVGGGGGKGGFSAAATISSETAGIDLSMGGSGGGGGNAFVVDVTSDSNVETTGAQSAGIVAQSVGGGGGSGGMAVAGSLTVGGGTGVSLSLGGSGGNGGYGNWAGVSSSGAVHTRGERSPGLLAQSTGGGGGNGGLAVSGSLSFGKDSTALNVALGGSGGTGGSTVPQNMGDPFFAARVVASGSVVTEGASSPGIEAQSIGGGGGDGGISAAGGLSTSSSTDLNLALGGTGGAAGNASGAGVTFSGSVTTAGDLSQGILVQGLGGGGGNGGLAVTGEATLGETTTFSLGVGGSGGGGGLGGQAVLQATGGSVQTSGAGSDGVLVQSVGGGGGNGAMTVNVAESTKSSKNKNYGVSVGGSGADGSKGWTVEVTAPLTVTTTGANARGVVAQSVGGTGGNGAANLFFSQTSDSSAELLSLNVGGTGGSAGDGGSVTVETQEGGKISTGDGRAAAPDQGDTDVAHALVAQSIGGGGGTGQMALSGGVSTSGKTGIAVALGGSGGAAGSGGAVSVTNHSTLLTQDHDSHGVLAQSIGGGGGNGGVGIGGSVTNKAEKGLNLALGGSGGAGGAGGSVWVYSDYGIAVGGDNSAGIMAQSIGGGGGNGATAIRGSLNGSSAKASTQLSVALGGGGGAGGDAGGVQVESWGTIATGANSTDEGTGMHAIIAQSLGGGGGNGGAAIRGNLSNATDTESGTLAVGGSGGTAGDGGSVSVKSQQALATHGAASHGILAQSIGGGGGSGEVAISGNVTNKGSTGLTATLGGSGGAGGRAGSVYVYSLFPITVSGGGSRGILAQSIGGGGGTGQSGIGGDIDGSDSKEATQLALALGGNGGKGGDGNGVTIENLGAITTGTAAGPNDQGMNAIEAQSIGGGGGDAGAAVGGSIKGGADSQTASLALGGAGGTAGAGKSVTVTNQGALQANGADSHGILAQSLGGGGGVGGIAVGGDVVAKGKDGLSLLLGGSGGAGGAAGKVTVTSDHAVAASGDRGKGIVAQSIGGGGGIGATALAGSYDGSGAGETEQLALQVELGGQGGKGGGGGAVTVTSSGNVTTGTAAGPLATAMHAILAQSIGGGGGDGGMAIGGTVKTAGASTTGTLALGGSGGDGGDGNSVHVSSQGTLRAGGIASHGILAQSLGGGGGSGAVAIGGGVEANGKEGLTLALGGGGGSAGAGGSVTVYSDHAIFTAGDGGKGILAQSIGGGGGSGATAIGGDLDGAESEAAAQLVLALGGQGGSGVDGGSVSVQNYGGITTGSAASRAGSGMDAIFAQSLGGGGGSGGIGLDGNLTAGAGGTLAALSFGGEGSGGGSGGAVSVTNTQGLHANGNGSRGIVAQSIGGGGGDGAVGIGGDVGAGGEGGGPQALTFAMGSSGGYGGMGGDVTVTTSGAITTAAPGELAFATHGVLAQSIGGGGGNAAMGIGGEVSGDGAGLSLSMLVGSAGGAGGNAGKVSVTNSGSVTVAGDASSALFAQSVGGGGGSGALGFGGGVTAPAGSVAVLALGGDGGGAGSGGAVTLTNAGSLTSGDAARAADPVFSQSYGMFGQSVGGGGGSGALAGSLSFGGAGGGNTLVLSAFAYEAEGDGGAVHLGNTGSIATYFRDSHGLFAQSVGGGGGDAGDLGGVSGNAAWSAQISVGGNANSGNGGAISVVNGTPGAAGGDVLTYGPGSAAIFAQTVGGGGGSAGGAAGLLAGLGHGSFDVLLGGAASSARGDGGAIEVLHQGGTLATQGAGAPGVFAQSVGGGGGVAAYGLAPDGAPVTLAVGGDASGVSGNGGNVQVEVSGSIATGLSFAGSAGPDSVAAHGIVAQSVGGGGGYAGAVLMSAAQYGAALPMNPAGHASHGNGGWVMVQIDPGAVVETHGSSSVGVLAQSVGGGGGVSGVQSARGTLIGSNGGTGSANLVEVDVMGAVVTDPAAIGAHGIVAQAAGGGGVEGTPAQGLVSVSVSGSVQATGPAAHGILAQSSGANAGPITVEILPGGLVEGGVEKLAAGEGAEAKGTAEGGIHDDAGLGLPAAASGIALLGGPATITNSGTITTAGGLDGTAIGALGGEVSVLSDGRIIGDLLTAGTARMVVENRPGGLLAPGQRLLLGEGGSLSNAGTLEFAGSGRIAPTLMQGDLTQTPEGRLVFDLSAGLLGEADLADGVDVTGRAELAGTVQVRLLGFGQERSERQSIQLLAASDGLEAAGLTVAPSALAQFRLESGAETGEPGAATLLLSYRIDFLNPDAAGALDAGGLAVARHLDALHRAGAVPAGLAFLGGAATAQDYAQALDQLSPQPYATNLWTAGRAGLRFGEGLGDCRQSPLARAVEGGCVALSLGGWSGDGPDYSFSGRRIGLQVEAQLGDDWTLGGGLGYLPWSAKGDGGIWRSEGELTQAGLYLRREFDAFTLTAALYGGRTGADTTRYTGADTSSSGSQDLRYVGALLRGERAFAAWGGTLRAGFELAAVRTESDAFTESGGPGSLSVGSAGHTSYSLHPQVAWSRELAGGGGFTLRPSVGLGLTHYLNDPGPSVSASLLAGGGAAPPMQVGAEVPRTWADLSLGLSATRKDGLSLGAALEASFAEGNRDLRAGLQVRMPF